MKDIYDSQYDCPEYTGDRTYYLICAAPRVGSWLLCDLLEASGVMGVPAEYFNPESGLPNMGQRLDMISNGDVNLDAYMPKLIEHRTSPNGVFGAKIQFWQSRPLTANRLFSKHMPGLKFIYLSRRDFIRQGVSYEIARQTGQWTSRHDGKSLHYDEAKLQEALNFVMSERSRWEYFFGVNEIEPLRIDYEDLTSDTDAVCRAVCDLVGVETDFVFSLGEARIDQQRNLVNEEWRRRLAETGGY